VTQFSALWPHMSGNAVIDILLVAVIIYELLALIKGTRAAYMLVGVAVLALALYFSSVGELATLNWLLSALLPYTVFALIVVFSAEIRQALAGLAADSYSAGDGLGKPMFTTISCWRPTCFPRTRRARSW